MTVIDAIMGSGKTSYAIQYINEHPEKSFVYCTPFLAEVQRIKESCPDANFREPSYADGRKIDSFNNLLMSGENIVLTHSTFTNANDQTIEYIKNSDYILILDETINTLEDFNNVCSDATQRVKKADIKMLLECGFIVVDSYGKVSWSGNSYLGSKFTDVERFAKNGTLLYLDGSMLVWEFPAHIFDLFSDVMVLTYLFNGSILKPYFQYHDIAWTLKSVECINKEYFLTDYKDNSEIIVRCRSLIDVFDNTKANNYKNKSLSKNWYHKNIAELKQLRNHLNNFFRNVKKAKAEDILWTCPKDYESYLKGAGYISVRRLTAEEKKLPDVEKEKLEKRLSCFLPCNAKATNDYKDRSVLAYCSNMFLNPFIKKYFERKAVKDNIQIEVNEDLFALSCMLQWIWRSRIRDEKPISIYIPSMRMRKLFDDWLNLRL